MVLRTNSQEAVRAEYTKRVETHLAKCIRSGANRCATNEAAVVLAKVSGQAHGYENGTKSVRTTRFETKLLPSSRIDLLSW
jgi:hypothetical protein